MGVFIIKKEYIMTEQVNKTLKAIGLIGGLTYESTGPYYQIINETVQKELGGSSSAEIIMYSFNFAQIADMLLVKKDFVGFASLLGEKAKMLEDVGADCIVIAANTAHRHFDIIQSYTSVPILHIADPTAAEVKKTGAKDVLLLGTIFTMEEDFYIDRLRKAGLNVIIPQKKDRDYISYAIYDDICKNKTEKFPEIKKNLIRIIQESGVKDCILGCTKLGLLIKPEDVPTVRFYDTTVIHAKAVADFAMGKSTRFISRHNIKIPEEKQKTIE